MQNPDAVKKSTSPEMAFTMKFLKKNRKAEYAALRDKAAKKGMTIYPIMYGKAQYTLGIVRKKAKKVVKAAKRVVAAFTTPAKRGPGRPRKTASMNGLDGLAGIVQQVREMEREVAAANARLAKIAELASA